MYENCGLFFFFSQFECNYSRTACQCASNYYGILVVALVLEVKDELSNRLL